MDIKRGRKPPFLSRLTLCQLLAFVEDVEMNTRKDWTLFALVSPKGEIVAVGNDKVGVLAQGREGYTVVPACQAQADAFARKLRDTAINAAIARAVVHGTKAVDDIIELLPEREQMRKRAYATAVAARGESVSNRKWDTVLFSQVKPLADKLMKGERI